MKNDCDIINDLLPNYVEDICNDTTNAYIQEHLSTCTNCNAIYEAMKMPNTLDITQISEKKAFSKIKNKHRNQLISGIFISLILSLLLGTTLVSNFTKFRFNAYLKSHYPQYNLELSNFRYEDLQTLGFGTGGSYIADVYAKGEEANSDLKFSISTHGFLLKITDNYHYQIEQTKIPTKDRLLDAYIKDVKYTLIHKFPELKLDYINATLDYNQPDNLTLNNPYNKSIDSEIPIQLSIAFYSDTYNSNELSQTIDSIIKILKENGFNPELYNFDILNSQNESTFIDNIYPNYKTTNDLENIIKQYLKSSDIK